MRRAPSNVLIESPIPFLAYRGRFQQVVLHQGRIERFFLDSLKKHSNPHIKVERGVIPDLLELDTSSAEDLEAYPIKLRLRHLSDEEATPAQGNSHSVGEDAPEDGLFRSNLAADDTDDLIRKARDGKQSETEIVRAKYVIGCDGAHSWTRRQLGFKMEGEQTDFIWGVLDIQPITDFPDIRMRCAIHSANSGSVMVIPRENKLVRLYIQLTEVNKDGGAVDRSTITPQMILKAAQKIMSPYTITYKYCDWWTAYQIGQRVGNNFSASERVFLAGDAVHTHSPKAGQGMNVSMQDCFNLGWKIAGVVNGTLQRSVLKTYQSERRRIAQDLIEFDHRFSRLFSGRPAKDAADEAGISMSEFKDAFVKGNMFASGIAVDYGSSSIVAKPGNSSDQGDGTDVASCRVVGKQELATEIKLGMRMPSFKVLNQSDARPWHFQERLNSDGRFRIVVFAGDVTDSAQMDRVQQLGKSLAAPDGVVRRFTPKDKKIDSVIDILTIHCGERQKVEMLDFPEIFHPFDEKSGWDYSKVFADAVSYHEADADGKAYEKYGVNRRRGCIVVTRPDQYVGYVGELEDVGEVGKYFDGVLMPVR
ncbi:hypothetical protein B0A49_04491 [Cryomyces minteri]|uniref:Phenol 2-monooxygenase n=1 Tax=Cryomyces minteri TaxID=331657 RepID=A0A4U0WW47_9PEZI|nr:hypothetical protein B0A49_04491 [Cryomyces minteri]